MKISLNNFVIPNFIIKSICRDFGCYVMDVSIEISKENKQDTSPVAFAVPDNLSRKQINLMILSKYISNFENIHGIVLDANVMQGAMHACAVMCDMYFDNSEYPIPSVECSQANFPFHFIASKNIIYPYFNISAQDHKIECKTDGVHDFALTDSGISFGLKNLKYEFRDAFIMMAVDSIEKRQSNNEVGYIYKSVNNPDVMRMLFGFATPYFNDDASKADLFFGILQMYCDSMASRPWFESRFPEIKTARSDMDGNFWIYGLIEKMLAPARGPDFTVTKKWAPITNEVWMNIEEARRKAGLTGASLEFMLQVKDHGSSEDGKSIQSLIEEMRS